MPGTSRLALEAARGDPFFGAVFKGIAGLAGRAIGGLIPRPPVTPAARTPVPALPGGGVVSKALGPVGMLPGVNIATAVSKAMIPMLNRNGVTTTPSRNVIPMLSAAGGGFRRRRRTNPANIRALRRAISRVTSFERLASRVLKTTHSGKRVSGFKRRARRKR